MLNGMYTYTAAILSAVLVRCCMVELKVESRFGVKLISTLMSPICELK